MSPDPDTPVWYSLYGLTIQSDVRLPVGPALPIPPSQADIVIRCHDSQDAPAPDGPEVISIPCDLHGTDMVEHRGPSGVWIRLHSFGLFHVSSDTRRVDVYPHPHADQQAVGLALSGPILLFARHHRGRPSLHASAIVTEHGAVAFLGAQKQGKSTLAASFLARGAVLLTDDALPLLVREDGIYAEPGPPVMKVWSGTVLHTLKLSDDLPNVMPFLDKKLLSVEGRYARALQPTRLHTLYLLDRYDPVTTGRIDTSIEQLHGADAIVTLLKHVSGRTYLLPADDALALPVLSRLVSVARVRRLTYPHGFEYQGTVHSRITEDLAEL